MEQSQSEEPMLIATGKVIRFGPLAGCIKKIKGGSVQVAKHKKLKHSPSLHKETWQMTQGEFIDKGLAYAHRTGASQGDAYRVSGFIHERAVAEAVATGKPVPPEVLADYPGLTTRVGGT